ncbi:hypothetical protein [Tropicibacter oceani]|uniref:Uncharacterized protein n=1 Tax=Tropicibacter oceani TaxID=3058420 RepID=A0ABY8QGE6_9RHOB|nr:hypothetical protein [Tropicibacter oceani]WGW03701.1 hypothetical protein QF118_17555 [Tropicibacter oceani]
MANPLRGPLRPGAMILMTGLLIGLSGCAQFPELDAVQTPGIEQAPYPALVPLDGLLANPEPRATLAVLGQVQGRVSGLQARADRLRRMRATPAALSDRVARLRQKAATLRAAE